MRIVLGALAATILMLLLAVWRLHAVNTTLAEARVEVAGLHESLRQQAEANTETERRLSQQLTDLDGALARLQEASRINAQQLTRTLQGIDRIQPTVENPNDESIACLDVPAAADLDQWLR